MSLMDNGSNGMVMPVSPMYGGGGYGNSFGYGGDGLFWIIILFLFAAMSGGWGNGFGAGNGGALPYMMNQNTQADIQRVVDQQSVMTGISALSAAQANGFSNAEISRCNGLYNLTSQLNNIAMNQQNCCCENRAAVADLKYTVAQEGSATRDNTNAKVQQVLDKLCQLELDGVKQRNADLLAENQSLKFDRSQVAQDAFVQNAINNAINRVNPTPIPAYTVQNPNCCSQFFNTGCGCSAA